MSEAAPGSPEVLMFQDVEVEVGALADAAEEVAPPPIFNLPNVFDAFNEGFNGFPDEDDEDENDQPDVVIWQDNDANNFAAWDNQNALADELAMGVPAPVYVVQGFGAVDEDDDDQDEEDAVGGAVGNAVQEELQALFEAEDPGMMHNFYQPLLDMSSGMAASLSKLRQARNRPVKPLLRLSMLKFLRTVDVRAADRILQLEMPRTLFYDLLHVALYSKDSRSMMIQLILKHWPERTLKVAELKKCVLHLEAPIPFSPCTAEKTLLTAFFSGFGNTERKHLRCLDLRGANERFLDRLEEYQGFYTDPFFKSSEYCIILPIRYVYRRAYALDYILHDWLKVLRKSPTFFKISSLTMDFTKNEEMEIMNFMTIEHMESLHLGRYRLYRDEGPPQPLEHPFQQHQQAQHEINHFSPAASDWRNRVCLFSNLTSLTISSMSTISPLRKIIDKSSCAPDAPLVESWSGILRELTKLNRLSVVFQTLNGQLKRLLDGANFKLLSLSLEGSVLDDVDLDFLREFMVKQSQTVTKVHLGIWNFKEQLEKVMAVLAESKEVNTLTLQMSGRLDQRDQRRIPRDLMRRLASCLRGSVKDLRMLHLCDFNLDTPGLVVELIDSLLPKSSLVTLVIPTKVLRTMEDGTSVPFLGDLKRMGSGSKYEPFVEAYKRHLCATDLKNFTAKATYDGIKFSTSRQTNRMTFALR